MKLQFWGAARTVTGSMHLVEVGGRRLLLDCGLYQGHRKQAFEIIDPCAANGLRYNFSRAVLKKERFK